jgi:hypothetical protein
MTRYYPSQNDMNAPDRLERVHRDTYDRIYALESKLLQHQAALSTALKVVQTATTSTKATTTSSAGSTAPSVVDGGAP